MCYTRLKVVINMADPISLVENSLYQSTRSTQPQFNIHKDNMDYRARTNSTARTLHWTLTLKFYFYFY